MSLEKDEPQFELVTGEPVEDDSPREDEENDQTDAGKE